jgi:hypothetical protein
MKQTNRSKMKQTELTYQTNIIKMKRTELK